jgi:hypothetical protein
VLTLLFLPTTMLALRSVLTVALSSSTIKSRFIISQESIEYKCWEDYREDLYK